MSLQNPASLRTVVFQVQGMRRGARGAILNGRFPAVGRRVAFLALVAAAIGSKLAPFIFLQLGNGANGTDFSVFVSSARALESHANPYALATGTWQNMNPPVWFGLFSLLARVPDEVGVDVVRCGSLLIAAMVVLYLARRYQAPHIDEIGLLLFGTASLWTTIGMGQVYLLLLPLATVGWVLLEEEADTSAGLALGVLTALKPNLVAWPVLLLLNGRRRAGIVALLSAALASALPVLFLGVTDDRLAGADNAGNPRPAAPRRERIPSRSGQPHGDPPGRAGGKHCCARRERGVGGS